MRSMSLDHRALSRRCPIAALPEASRDRREFVHLGCVLTPGEVVVDLHFRKSWGLRWDGRVRPFIAFAGDAVLAPAAVRDV